MSAIGPGARIGPYEVLEVIGQGGYGEVVRARAPDGRIVALKLLLRMSGTESSRFGRERRLLETLGEDQGFVSLRDAGTSQHGPFIVLDFVEGGTLARRIARGPLGVEETRALGIALARALAEAHARGIVHRDLKPSNILLRSDGRPLIADLGLAKHYESGALGAHGTEQLTKTGSMHGTMGYMPAEQLTDAKTVGPQADVFALGVVLYECLTGVKPFEAVSVVELVTRVVNGRFKPIRALRPEVPADLAATIERCLAPTPAGRPSDGAAAARDLEHPPAAPRSVLLGAVLALVLVLALAVVLAMTLGRGAPPPPPPPLPPSPTSLAPPGGTERDAGTLARAALGEVKKDPVAALADAQRALDLDPRCALALYARAKARLRSAETRFKVRTASEEWTRAEAAAAFADVDESIRRDPRNAGAWSLRAYMHMVGKRPTEAIADAQRALELDPREPVALFIRSSELVNSDRDRARADLDVAIEVDPELAAAIGARGVILHKQGDDDGAVRDLLRCLELEPENGSMRAIYAQILLNEGRLEDAYREADRAIERAPDNAMAWAVRGSARAEGRNEVQEGAQDLSRAVELTPKDAVAWNLRGRLRHRLGDLDGALEDTSQAIALWRGYAAAYDERAAVFLAKGDKDRARADSKECIRIAPTSPAAARCRERLARLDGE